MVSAPHCQMSLRAASHNKEILMSLKKLQQIYLSQCNGDWEHSWGITISTIDNPGWWFSFQLEGTPLALYPLDKFIMEKDANDWLHCWKKDNVFEGACSPQNLEKLINIFVEWWETGLSKIGNLEEHLG